MPIYPLPQFEADLEEDRKIYERLKPPSSIVVRFGVLKMVGEFPYDGDAKPGCGSKIVVRSPRGTEIGEMLTSTCPNSGCSKSVSRKQMLEYIENSGGRDYPFFSDGKVLRIATPEDMERQSQIEQSKHGLRMEARRAAEEVMFEGKIVDVEPLLGGERITVYFNSEQRVDFRDLVRNLGHLWHNRVEMRQIGARDEARITADYERCGQYCCCKNFLKVLKPVSMRSAKVQKATLDPLKISGRCGRLMCCLRYEDATYEELRKRLPRKKQRVGTPEGDGFVIDTQILTQLALIQLEAEDKQVAIAVEDLTEPASATPVPRREEPDRSRRPGGPSQGAPGGGQRDARPREGGPREARDARPRPQQDPARPQPPQQRPPSQQQPPRTVKLDLPPEPPGDSDDELPENDSLEAGTDGPDETTGQEGTPPGEPQAGQPRKRRRRRRRGRRPGGPEGNAGPGPNPPAPPPQG